LQVYGQLFLARGGYSSLRNLVGPGVFEPAPVGEAPAGFTTHELHTNAVLRWEYMPGSTLYLVWSQARNGEGQEARSALGDNIADAFRLAPSNVLLLKLTYWWNV